MNRRTLLALAACLLLLSLWMIPQALDWYDRHYGMGFSDRMNIRVTMDGEPLPPSAYALAYSLDGDYKPANRTETGYSIDSDYGLYSLRVDAGGGMIGFAVENANNWWRTDILLELTRLDDGTTRVVKTLDVVNDEDHPPETEEWLAR